MGENKMSEKGKEVEDKIISAVEHIKEYVNGRDLFVVGVVGDRDVCYVKSFMSGKNTFFNMNIFHALMLNEIAEAIKKHNKKHARKLNKIAKYIKKLDTNRFE